MKEETLEQLKQIGLDYAETLSRESFDGVLKVIEVLVKDTETPLDDAIVLPMLEVLKPIVYSYIDDINGSKDQ